jgi:hypothetical protein
MSGALFGSTVVEEVTRKPGANGHTYNLSYLGSWGQEDHGSKDPIFKTTRAKWTRGAGQALEFLLCKCEALSSNQKKKHQRQWEVRGEGLMRKTHARIRKKAGNVLGWTLSLSVDLKKSLSGKQGRQGPNLVGWAHTINNRGRHLSSTMNVVK